MQMQALRKLAQVVAQMRQSHSSSRQKRTFGAVKANGLPDSAWQVEILRGSNDLRTEEK
jgi:hypothetical protein